MAAELLNPHAAGSAPVGNIQAFSAVDILEVGSVGRDRPLTLKLLIGVSMAGELLQKRIVARAPAWNVQAVSAPVVNDQSAVRPRYIPEIPPLVVAAVAVELIDRRVVAPTPVSDVQAFAAVDVDEFEQVSGPGGIPRQDADGAGNIRWAQTCSIYRKCGAVQTRDGRQQVPEDVSFCKRKRSVKHDRIEVEVKHVLAVIPRLDIGLEIR